MPKYFDVKKKDDLPLKYKDQSRYIFKPRKVAKGHVLTLFDLQQKVFVVKNAVAASRPRFLQIAGNEFYPGLHERLRMMVVEHLKSEFQKHFPSTLGLKFPIRVACEIHTLPRYRNWDLDNMWIYTKCFMDALKDHPVGKLIPDDSVNFISESPGFRFIPVTKESERKLLYTFTEDEDPRITGHLMYNMLPCLPGETKEIQGWLLSPTSNGKSGDITLDVDKETIFVNIGKGLDTIKQKCYDKVFYHCIQLNIRNMTTTEDMNGTALRQKLADKGVKIWILK